MKKLDAGKELNSGVDFDSLVQATMEAANGDMTALDSLYGHAFALPQWYFIARGDFPEVHPYIASNAEFADGLPMIRAFTDPDRLQRFAAENDLREPDGGSLILSIPTDKCVGYLEQFIVDGAHGIWFNSDVSSYGFFVPLKQLRPIQEHLERLHQKALSGE